MFKLRVQNFRGFLDEEFDFSRINILIGENSAGKSSVLKFLSALKQSLRPPNNKDYNLTFAGDSNLGETDLGNYHEIIYNHETDRNLIFSFELGEEYFDFLSNFYNIIFLKNRSFFRLAGINLIKEFVINEPTIIEFELNKDLSNHSNIKTRIYNKQFGNLEITTTKNINLEELCNLKFTSIVNNETYNFEKVPFEKHAYLTIIKDYKINYSKIKTNQDILWHFLFMTYVSKAFYLILQQIEYVNPILSQTERVYLQNDKKTITKIRNIKDLIDYFNETDKTKYKNDLIEILKDFGIANNIYVKNVGQTNELRIVNNQIDSNIKDVGFGVSLQLPIFAEALISENTQNKEFKNGKILLIEQPEVHLHPNLQAKFIEALIKIGKNNIYFIETHSEHIVRMLQVMVKEKRYGLESKDVSIHYFKKEGMNMVKSKHEINDETGKLMPNFPKGFYDVSYNLAFQLMD